MRKTRICEICRSPVEPLFQKKILNRHDAWFSRCSDCGFVQSDEPHWLPEAYASPLSMLDTALVSRPLYLRQCVSKLIQTEMNPEGRFLDYGGGAGLFTRMMRDIGYDFYRSDKFARNIFTLGYDIEDVPPALRKWELVTAFEVLEHTVHPLEIFQEIFAATDYFLFSTETIPEMEHLELWPYIGADHGQHISFYSPESLRRIADAIGVHYTSCGKYLHLMSRKRVEVNLDPSSWRQALIYRAFRKLRNICFRPEEYWLTRRTPLTDRDNKRLVK